MDDTTPSPARVRNRRTWRDTLARLRGSPTVVDLRRYDASLDEIGRLGPELQRLPDEQLTTRARALRTSVKAGTALHDVRAHFFAMAREAADRAIGQRPFDQQLVAALALDDSAIAEMQTGEGKTLAGVLLAGQHALAGRGVHVLTFNERLCGMTGTAQAAADELWETYATPVVVIPTHRPVVRRDRPDVVFTHRDPQDHAIVEGVRMAHGTGRPVLVGTRTVADSERLAALLTTAGIACSVFNARDDCREAEVIAAAGMLGAVTISTNMAGRGTDIRLGGADAAARAQVVALGGLYVIGTTRHESRRVDHQLRGRAGRQGDPGETRFLLSLDDDLLVRFGIDRLIPAAVWPAAKHTPIEHPVVRREVARAQRIAEGQDREIRRTLARYAAVVDDQYAAFRERRLGVLRGGAPDRDEVLGHMDGRWSDHLALCEDLREGIHLVRLGGRDPLAHYTAAVMHAFDVGAAAPVDDHVWRPTDRSADLPWRGVAVVLLCTSASASIVPARRAARVSPVVAMKP